MIAKKLDRNMIDLLYYARSLYKRFRLEMLFLSRISKPF